MDYQTWLFLREPANETLEAILRRLDLLRKANLGPRVQVQTVLCDQHVALVFPEGRPDVLFNALARTRSVLGFSLAPSEHLKALHLTEFLHGDTYLQAVWLGAAETYEALPYAHRLVRLQMIDYVAAGRPGSLGKIYNNNVGDGFQLLIDPILVNFCESDVDYLFRHDAELLRHINCFFCHLS